MAVSFSLSVADDNSVTLIFSAAYALSPSMLKVMVEGYGEVNFELQQLSSSEYQVVLSLEGEISEGASISAIIEDNKVEAAPIELENNEASGTLNSQPRKKSQEEQTAASVKSTTQAVTTVAVTAVTVAGISSGNMSSAWSLINSMHFLGYVPMMDLGLPLPLLEFFKSLLFNYLPNSFKYYVPDESGPTPTVAKRVDTNSTLFLLVAGDLVTVFCVSLIAVPLAMLLSKIRMPSIARYFSQKLQGFHWNYFVRFLLEGYIEILFAGYLNAYDFQLNSATKLSCTALASLSILVCYITPFALLLFTLKHYKQFSSDWVLKERYSTLFYEFKSDRGFWSCSYYSIFIIRRLIYMSSLYLLQDYPGVQVIVNLGHSLMVTFYLFVCQPFLTKAMNLINIYNEVSIFLAFAFSGFFLFDLSSEMRDIMQWTTFGIVYAMIFTNICVTALQSAAEYINLYRKWRRCIGTKGRSVVL